MSVWRAPRAVLAGDEVARLIAERPDVRPPVWLRLAEVDARPGVLAAAVCRAVAHNAPDIAELLAPRLASPSAVPCTGADVGAALGAVAPDGFVLVFEDVAGLGPTAELRALTGHFAGAVRTSASLLVLAEGRSPRWTQRDADGGVLHVIGARARRAASDDRRNDPLALRVAALARGRTGLVGDVLACADGRRAVVEGAARRSRRWGGFARRLTSSLLSQAGPVDVEALETAARTGYLGPDADGAVTVLRPWLVPLVGGGHWLRPAWTPALRAGLASVTAPARPARQALPELPVAPVAQVAQVGAVAPVATASPPGPEPAERCGEQAPVVRARLLGSFELEIDGRPVVEWRGRRGVTVLKYLLARPKRSCPRDVLLEEFWPEADPDRARNRLQVALSAVRRAVRTVADIDLVEHADGNYRIPPDLDLDVDVDRFEELIEGARRADLDGRADDAVELFEAAASVYRGDLLADDPYESWTVLERESLRVTYLDVLDRLAQLHIEAGRTNDCMEVARRILGQDECREDAHRLLMRCYARLGRVTQVDRQYELCRRSLADRLGGRPSPATVALHRELRHRASDADQGDWSY